MLVDRGALIDEIAGYLRDSVSVTLTGLRHSGRSEAARAVAERLRELDHNVVEVVGVAGLRDRPMAALVLAGLPVPAVDEATVSISAAVEGLAQLLPTGDSVLVVDNSEDLDRDSLGAVAAAHHRQGFPVLTVARPARRRRPPAHVLSAQLQRGVRMELPPLDYDQVNRLVHAMLPGPVDPAAVGRIAMLSGGLAGLVEAIVYIGRRTGAFVQGGALWRLRDELRNVRLADVVEPLLADVTNEEMDALCALALSGPLSSAAISAGPADGRIASQTLSDLIDLGLVQSTESTTGPVVEIFPPLLGDYLRSTGDIALSPPAPEAGDLHLASSSDVARYGLTKSRAALFSLRVAEHGQAQVNALRATWRAERTPRNAAPLLAALSAVGAEPARFAEVLDQTPAQGADLGAIARLLTWHAAYRALILDDLDGAHALLKEGADALPERGVLLRAGATMIDLMTGSELLAGVDPPAAPDEQDPVGSQALAIASLHAAIAAGRTGEALDMLADIAPSQPFYVECYRVGVGLARVLHGDLDGGVQWALQAMADAEARLDLGELQAHAYVAALGLAFAGRLDELQTLLAPVLSLSGSTVLWEQYQIGLLGLASRAAGWRGQDDYAWALAVQTEVVGRRAGPFPAMTHGVTPIRSLLPEGWGGTPGRLWDAAEEYLEKGYLAAGITQALTAVEVLPDPVRAAPFTVQARRAQSPLLVAFGDYIQAAAQTDEAMLARCVEDFQARGARLYAVKAAVTRALVLRGSGRLAESVQQAEDAWQQATEMGAPATGLFARLGQAVGLTPREHDIVRLLVKDVSLPRIARTLDLAERTVENYLTAAYRKLGAANREDLLHAASTWAALTLD